MSPSRVRATYDPPGGLWNSLADGFILDAFGQATGADVSGATDAIRSVLPAAGTRLPVVL